MNPRTKRALAVLGGAVVIGAITATVMWWRAGAETGTITLYGNVDIREVALGFRVGGRLDAVDFDEGATIQAGQRVAALDGQPYREALDAANARLAAAEANYAKLQHGPRVLEIAQARAQMHEVEANYKNAEIDYRRQKDLREHGAVSQTTLDAARALRDSLAAKLATARATLALEEEGYRTEDIEAARAERDAARAARAQAQTQLADTVLLAPANGTILARVLEPGSIVAVGSPVFTLSLDSPVYVRAYAAEPDLGQLAPGSRVTITTDSSEHVYHGHIGFVSPRAEFTPRAVETTALRTDLVYRLRIVVSDPDSGLRQGMPVTVQLERSSGEG
jgi:HlyD family secretion protein